MSTDSHSIAHPLGAALEAESAGLCVIRVKTDGSKMPEPVRGWGRMVDGKRRSGWERFQTERPSTEQLQDWFADGWPGLGIVCGAVSGGLNMLELEGRAIEEGIGERLDEQCIFAGCFDVLQRITNGYLEISPSGGLHLLYKVEGGHVEGNLKLARRLATDAELAENPADRIKVLIETRGEGGFVVVAPSSGTVHKSGQPWVLEHGRFADIATVTVDEHERILEACRALDAMPPGVTAAAIEPRTDKLPVSPYDGGDIGESWVAAVQSHLAATTTMPALLHRYGWTDSHTSGNRQYLTRPGKDSGVSGAINESGRLIVFSSSTPFDSYAGAGHAPSHDLLDVIAVYEHSGDRMAAARIIADETGIHERWQQQRREQKTPRDTALPSDDPWYDPYAEVPPPTDDDAPAIDPFHLPDVFWSTRPVLQHIRTAARARRVPPDTVLLNCLARVCALTHPKVVLPALVGSMASLNTFVANVAPPGSGKTASARAAAELIPIDDPKVLDDTPVGTGEGIVEAFFENVNSPSPNPKSKAKVVTRQQVRWGVLFKIDEGTTLIDLTARRGSTLVSTLRSIWSGDTIGATNASAETRRRLGGGDYRIAMTVSFQPAAAAFIAEDTETGTAARFVWGYATDPGAPDIAPAWPGQLHFAPPTPGAMGPTVFHKVLDVADSIREEVDAARLAAVRGETEVKDSDAHANLVRLKLAALLGLLEHRTCVTVEDWDLARIIVRTSNAVRRMIHETAQLTARRSEESYIQRTARREMGVATARDSAAETALERMAAAIARHVHNGPCDPDGCRRRCCQQATGSADRALTKSAGGVDAAIERAATFDWIALAEIDGTARYLPGKGKPA